MKTKIRIWASVISLVLLFGNLPHNFYRLDQWANGVAFSFALYSLVYLFSGWWQRNGNLIPMLNSFINKLVKDQPENVREEIVAKIHLVHGQQKDMDLDEPSYLRGKDPLSVSESVISAPETMNLLNKLYTEIADAYFFLLENKKNDVDIDNFNAGIAQIRVVAKEIDMIAISKDHTQALKVKAQCKKVVDAAEEMAKAKKVRKPKVQPEITPNVSVGNSGALL